MVDPVSNKASVIDLATQDKEYQFVLSEFIKTMKLRAIVKIQRIQNPALYGQFIAKKKQLDFHNPKGIQNERWLFHGTRKDSLTSINRNGFNRNFRGRSG